MWGGVQSEKKQQQLPVELLLIFLIFNGFNF